MVMSLSGDTKINIKTIKKILDNESIYTKNLKMQKGNLIYTYENRRVYKTKSFELFWKRFNRFIRD